MSSNSTYITILTVITTNIPMIINFLTVILGILGGIGNLITFTASRLHSNSCVFYLLCASIFQIFSMLFSIPTRMALDNFGNNIEHQSIFFCKIRYYLVFTLPQLVTYYMLFAILDRCLATSNNVGMRSWNELKIAHRCSLSLLILIPGSNIHILVFYGIHQNTCQISPDSSYIIFFAIYMIVVITWLPHLLMFIFSLITINNLKKSRQRIYPINSNRIHHRIKRLEFQLILILLVQVILSSILVTLRLGSYIYTILTSGNLNKSIDVCLTEMFVLRLGIALYYFSFAISFYVSTLTSRFFREIFLKRICRFYRRLRRLMIVICR